MDSNGDKINENNVLQKLFENSFAANNCKSCTYKFSHNKETNSNEFSGSQKKPLNFYSSDSYTQTSKTILELAEHEIAEQPTDSLNNSPRNAEKDLSSFKSVQIKFARKNDIAHFIDSTQEEKFFPVKLERSLTQRFLENRNKKVFDATSTIYQNPKYNESNQNVSCQSKSKFLLQTSPLKNVVSVSEVDLPNFGETVPVSRFTVKQIHRQEKYKEMSLPVEQALPHKLEENKAKAKKNLKSLISTNNIELSVPKLMLSDIKRSPKSRNFPRSNSFMSPTISSLIKSQKRAVELTENLISPTRRGRSVSPSLNSSIASPERPYSKFRPSNQGKIPYIDGNRLSPPIDKGQTIKCYPKDSSPIASTTFRRPLSPPLHRSHENEEDLLKPKTKNNTEELENTLQINKIQVGNKLSNESINLRSSNITVSISSTSSEASIEATLAKLKNQDWNIALQGLAEIVGLCRLLDPEILYPYMPIVNRRLIDLLRSPRSHVCRTACQAAGHLFEYSKDTRRPEFDDIVDILLFKTADANKFIRQDANLSLDCMVTHIPIFHSLRALSMKGPVHKNTLVRTACIRLVVCAVVIAGADSILHNSATESTKKRIVELMARFLVDNCQEARKYGERLYKVLHKHPNFETVLKKYLDRERATRIKSIVKNFHKSNLSSF